MKDFGEVNIPKATEVPQAEPVSPVDMEQVNRKDGIGVNHDGSLTNNGFGSEKQANINKYGEIIDNSAQEESNNTNTPNSANRSNSYYGPTQADPDGITKFFESKDQILKASQDLQAQASAEAITKKTEEHISRTEQKHQERMEATKQHAEATLEDLQDELAKIQEQNASQHQTVEQQRQEVIKKIDTDTPDSRLNGDKKEYIGRDIRFSTNGEDAEQRLKELLGGNVQNPPEQDNKREEGKLSTVPGMNRIIPKTQEEKDNEILQELDPLKKDKTRTLTRREKGWIKKAVEKGATEPQTDKSNVRDLVGSAMENASKEGASRLATEEEMNNLNKLEEERKQNIQEINNKYAREQAEKRIDEDLAELRRTLNHQVALDKNEALNNGFNPLKPMSEKGQDFFERNYGNNPDPIAETTQDATTQEPTPPNNSNGIPVRSGNYTPQNMFGDRNPPSQPTDPEKRPDEIKIESYDPESPKINPEIPHTDPNKKPEQNTEVPPEVQALKEEIDGLKDQIARLTDLLNGMTDPTVLENEDPENSSPNQEDSPSNPEPDTPNTQEQTDEDTPDLPETSESEFIDAEYYDLDEDDERINVPEVGPQNRNMRRNKLIAGVIGGAAGFGTALAVGTGAAPVIGGVMTAATATTFGVKLISKARIDRLGQKMRESTDPEEIQKFEKRLNRWQKVSKGAELAKSFLVGAGIGLFAGTFVSGSFFGGEGLIDKFTQTPDVTPTVSGYDQGATSYADHRINPDGTIPGGNTRWEPPVEQITPNTPEIPNVELPANEQLVVDGRVNLPGSAWNGNLGGDPTGTLPGGELNFSNYLGSDTQMAANMLNKDLVDAGIKMSELTDKLTTPGVHRLLNGYLDAARAGVNPELTDVLGQMSNPGAKDIISMLNPK